VHGAVRFSIMTVSSDGKVNIKEHKEAFKDQLKAFILNMPEDITSEDGQWTIKGFIDIYKHVYTISSDTKIISKILEIHLFPRLLKFAEKYGYKIVPADHQNYYPDISFVKADDERIKYALDLKTTYRRPEKPTHCNGFTLGSHGEYFINRKSTKNIQFPYGEYSGHFCLGIIYDRHIEQNIDETKIEHIDNLRAIPSVITNLQIFIAEKWKIAGDKGGSGNTANIGSIKNIDDIINERGVFSHLGEDIFDEYWMNYGRLIVKKDDNSTKKLRSLKAFARYKGFQLPENYKKGSNHE